MAVRLVLLTARPDLGTNRRLAEAATAAGVELAIVDTATASAVAAGGVLRAVGDAVLETPPDGVIARVGNWRPESTLAVLEALVAAGAATPNPPSAIRIGRDHWSTVRALSLCGLPVPATVAGSDPETLATTAVRELGLPVVVKQRRSRMGVGVIRCVARDHLEAVLDSLWRLGDEIVVQQWMPQGVASTRVLVIAGETVAAARFRAAEGEWRSNGARGGSAESWSLAPGESSVAVAAAEALGLGHCAVDLVLGDEGPVVLEVNPTPGFLRLERATGIDIADAIVRGAIN